MHKMIDPGEMDQVITVRQETVTRTTSGAEETTMADWNTVRAKVEFNSGTEDEEMMKITFIKQAVFTFRYCPGLNEKMEIVHDGKTYDIHDIEFSHRKRFHIARGTARDGSI